MTFSLRKIALATGCLLLAGNVLAADLVYHFTIRAASDVQAASGVPEITTAPSANPGQQIGIAVPFDPSLARATFQVTTNGGNQTTATVNAFRFDAERGRRLDGTLLGGQGLGRRQAVGAAQPLHRGGEGYPLPRGYRFAPLRGIRYLCPLLPS